MGGAITVAPKDQIFAESTERDRVVRDEIGRAEHAPAIADTEVWVALRQ